jgi:dehydrogenase/reductase SDR family protein 12
MAVVIRILRFFGLFLPSFTVIGYWWRRLFVWPRFTPDFRGQTWVVTGASGGLGRAIVLLAAGAGAKVIAMARDQSKLRALAGEALPGSVTTIVADFSLKADTARATALLLDRLGPAGGGLDVLVNNVGVLLDECTVTAEGHETSFATNILSHFILTERLLARRALRPGGVVINMSSGGMYDAPLAIDAMDVTDKAKFNGVRAYAIHKRGQAALTEYWREREAATGLNVYVMHPGWADTQGVKTSLPRFRRVLAAILRSHEQGADTAIWLAGTKPANPVPDAFWFDRGVREAHAYEFTRTSKYTKEDLVRYLEGAAG